MRIGKGKYGPQKQKERRGQILLPNTYLVFLEDFIREAIQYKQ